MILTVHSRVILTAIPNEPPSEFRIFPAGGFTSSKGEYIFDGEAATSVISKWKQWGVDLIIDLNHDSLEASAASRPDASDARGHFQLELRDGELWAVNVRWTSDGERRIRERTQRYLSPTFFADDNGRISELLNVALVSMPATYGALPLIAASVFDNRLAARIRASKYLQLVRIKNGSRKSTSSV